METKTALTREDWQSALDVQKTYQEQLQLHQLLGDAAYRELMDCERL